MRIQGPPNPTPDFPPGAELRPDPGGPGLADAVMMADRSAKAERDLHRAAPRLQVDRFCLGLVGRRAGEGEVGAAALRVAMAEVAEGNAGGGCEVGFDLLVQRWQRRPRGGELDRVQVRAGWLQEVRQTFGRQVEAVRQPVGPRLFAQGLAALRLQK